MNPFPVVRATIQRHWASFALFSAIIGIAIAIGVILSAGERGFRRASARAADKFDVLVAAPGSQTDVVFSAIYLRPGTVPLLNDKVLALALAEKQAKFAAPIAFGDNHQGAPIIGTIAPFVEHLSDGLSEGRAFTNETEAVVGAFSPLAIGASFKPEHGAEHHQSQDGAADDDAEIHDIEIKIVGRMKATGTPWDRAIVVPVEQVWRTHSLPNGHRPGESRIGVPFDPEYLSSVPVIVMHPESVVAAYKLRGAFRTPESMAFFPAEVLIQLYGILGNIQSLLAAMSMASQFLVLLALLGGIIAVLSLSRRQFAVLRVLGAPRAYIMLCVWSYVALIIIAGCLLGLALGAAGLSLSSQWLGSLTGIAITPAIGWNELRIALLVSGIGFLLALYPAISVASRRPLDGLQ